MNDMFSLAATKPLKGFDHNAAVLNPDKNEDQLFSEAF